MANAHDTKLHRPKAPSSSVMNKYADMTDRISCEEDMLMEGQIVDDKSGGGEVDEGYFGDVASAFGGGVLARGRRITPVGQPLSWRWQRAPTPPTSF
ncbi:hypothetical protein GH5_08108 [Leishmania sp. Ghana 2012 LV757]|uniref:hypothetical protein n=1 Tax=Leishmania sp. Ghana 2012 LV757 TaxID=2803181 RepID=UPI001B481833|nr:hypothetical protein GH5_08108 [Leishmania sp. Ghana 2012 LV757]